VSLLLLCTSFALIVTPDAEHQIVRRGNDTTSFHAFVTAFADAAPLPFALAVGIDFAVAAWQLHDGVAAIIAGVVAAAVALTMWYGIELWWRKEAEKDVEGENEPTPIHDKIRQVLTESRVILPGAQATLGFQLIAMLTSGFGNVPATLKWMHFASLSLVALSVILLITPASWHRLVERGEETEEFHSLAAGFIVAALVPLAAGLTIDFYVVAWMVSQNVAFSAVATAVIGLIFGGLWFALSLIRRHTGVATSGRARAHRTRPSRSSQPA
jgi:hypothetical protein